MRFPRFRIRMLMFAVAVVAVLTAGGVGVWRLRQQSITYKIRSRSASVSESACRKLLDLDAKRLRLLEAQRSQFRLEQKLIPFLRKQSEEEYFKELTDRETQMAGLRHAVLQRAEYFAQVKKKYERAARYPWLPVEADPPEPK